MRNILLCRPFIKCLLALVFLTQASVFAQPVIEWDKTIGGTNNDELAQVLQTSDGGYLLGGSSNSNAGADKSDNNKGSGETNDYWIVKLSANGTKQWDKTFGTTDNDILTSMQQTADGGYILGGTSQGNFWIIKLGVDGAIQWDQSYGSEIPDALSVVRQTPDGGYILGGSSQLPGNPNDPLVPTLHQLYVVKIMADGTVQWEKSLGLGVTLTCLNLTTDGGYILGGYYGVRLDSDSGYRLLKLAADGTEEWTKTVTGTFYAEIQDVQQTPDNGFILGGWSYQPAGGDQKESSSGGDYWIVKLNANREIEWENVIGVPLDEEGSSNGIEEFKKLAQSPDGGYLLLGSSQEAARADKTENSINGSLDFWVVKIDANGNVLWDKTIGGSLGDIAASISTTSDGGYILGGMSGSNTGFNKSEDSKGGPADYWIVKLAPENAAKLLTFANTNLDFTVEKDASVDAKSVFLSASTGSPSVTLTKSANSDWLILPSAVLGSLSFAINTAGVDPGTYTAQVTAAAPAYTSAALNIELTITPVPGGLSTVRINAGGEEFTTTDGRVFSADKYFLGDLRVNSIAGGEVKYTTEDALYRSERSSGSFGYNIPVVNGDYVVVLHFAEIWFGIPGGRPAGAGQRLFHVDLGNDRVLTNYDIFAKAQGPLSAVEEVFERTVTNGVLSIWFWDGAANFPTVAAIEVIPKSDYKKTMQTLPPLADSYVFPSTENYGASPQLIVKAGQANLTRETYLKFPLIGISQVTSAKLRIYGRNVENTSPINLSVYGLENDSWNEMEINSGNAPASSFVPLSATNVDEVERYYDFDVTEFVQLQATGDQLVSFVLKNPTGKNRKLVFHSKENTSGNAPQLVINAEETTGSGLRTSAMVKEESIVTDINRSKSTIYPNPIKDKFTVKISGMHSDDISLELLNTSAQNSKLLSTQKAKAGQKVEMNISGLTLPSGIHFLKIKSEAKTEFIKLLVVK